MKYPFKVGDRIQEKGDNWKGPATVIELTEKGFKYKFDKVIPLIHRWGMSMQEGECYELGFDTWEKIEMPCIADKLIKKIRIWNHIDKKFLSINVDNYQLIYQGDIWMATKRVYSVPPNFTNFNKVHIISNNPDFTMQDFTGLLDKNSKMIYEGDIVNVDGCCLHKVVWDKKSAKFDLYQIDFHELYDLDLCIEWPLDLITVIGNIFENPELLK